MAKSKLQTKKRKAKPQATAKKKQPLPNWMTNQRWHAATLFLIGLLIYANTWSHDFAQDDAIVITENMFTKQGLAGISGILGNDTFFGFFKSEEKKNLVAGGRYRPLSLVMFAVEYAIFGENPLVGHLINSILYALIGVVLYFLIRQWWPPKKHGMESYWLAMSTAVLFAAHPLHTEVVANIKGRDEILTLLLSMLALLASLKGYQKKQWFWNLIAGVSFFLALMAKENAITFLAVVPLTYYFFTKANYLKIGEQWLYFMVPAALFLYIRNSILGLSLGGDLSLELMNNPFLKWNGTNYIPFTASEQWATILYTLGMYIWLLIFPHPLTHDYYPRHVEIMTFANWQVWLSLMVYVGLMGYALWGLRRKDPISYAILFFLATLSIVANIVFPIGTNMSERFMFMPSIGFALGISLLAYRLVFAKPPKLVKSIHPLYMGLAAIVLLYSVKTITRNQVWANNFTLFSSDIHTSPNSAKLRNALGGELLTQSGNVDETTQKAYRTEAIGHLKKAIEIHPKYKNAYLLLGNAYNYLEQYDASLQAYDQALAIDPNYMDATVNRGITLINAGKPDQAIPVFQPLMDLYPEDPKYRDLLANAYRDLGQIYGEKRNDLTNALRYLQEADQIKPNDYNTIRLMGVASGIQGNTAASIAYFKRAVDLNPTLADAYFNLGTAYLQAGDAANGQAMHEKAVALDPNIKQRLGGAN